MSKTEQPNGGSQSDTIRDLIHYIRGQLQAGVLLVKLAELQRRGEAAGDRAQTEVDLRNACSEARGLMQGLKGEERAKLERELRDIEASMSALFDTAA